MYIVDRTWLTSPRSEAREKLCFVEYSLELVESQGNTGCYSITIYCYPLEQSKNITLLKIKTLRHIRNYCSILSVSQTGWEILWARPSDVGLNCLTQKKKRILLSQTAILNWRLIQAHLIAEKHAHRKQSRDRTNNAGPGGIWFLFFSMKHERCITHSSAKTANKYHYCDSFFFRATLCMKSTRS